MIASLAESIFASVEETTLALLSLFEACADGRHVVLTRPLWDRSTAIRAWLDALPRRTRKEIENVFHHSVDAAAQAPRAARRIRVDTVHECRWDAPIPVLDVRTALRMLRAPLRLLVEDRFNDGAFVLKMIPPDRKPRISQGLDKGWVEVEHGGGIDRMRKRVEDVAADPVARARMWVMSDSDGRRRADPSRSALLLGEACETTPGAWPVAYHRLERRSIENYLPGEALGGAEHSRAVTAYRQLTEEQRHFYNMKAGLVGDVADGVKRRAYQQGSHAIDDADLPPLFRGLAPTTKEALRRGFGVGIADLFHDEGGVERVAEAAMQREAGPERARLVQSLFEGM